MSKILVDWSKLSPKQRELVNDYLETGSKIASYMRVYRAPGDPKTNPMYTRCYKIFDKPHVKAVIEQIQERAIQKAQIKADELQQANIDEIASAHQKAMINATWVLERAAQLADFNIAKFLTVKEGQAVYDFSEATEEDWYCIQEYTNDSTIACTKDEAIPINKIRLKTYDKLRALELVGKHVDVGAFKDKIELSGDQENPVQTITRKIVKPDGDDD